MNGIGALIFTLVAVAALAGGRVVAASAMLGAVLYLPQQQSLSIGGVNMTALRLVEVIMFLRIALRGELYALRPQRIDKLFALTYAYAAAVFAMRSSVGVQETIGWAVDAGLCYVIFRALVTSHDDVARLLRNLLLLFPVFLALLTIEVRTNHNPFAALGTWTSWVELREGKVRAMGSFRNPSLLGTVGACLLPLYLALGRRAGWRAVSIGGIVACAYIVVCANSGGPISGTAAGVLAWFLWRARARMRLIRIAIFGTLTVLGLAMDAPVWSLLERMSFITGGSGWHRAHLLTMAWQDFGKWWANGMPLSETVHWFPYTLSITGTADITNAFVDFGLKAGVPAMALFIWLISVAFGAVGRRVAPPQGEQLPSEQRFMVWALGCALLVHVVTYFNITYFDQTQVLWVMHLALISTLTAGWQVKSATAGAAAAAADTETPARAGAPAPSVLGAPPVPGYKRYLSSKAPT